MYDFNYFVLLLSFVFVIFELFSFTFLNFKSASLYISKLLKHHSGYYNLYRFVFLLHKIKRIVTPITTTGENLSRNSILFFSEKYLMVYILFSDHWVGRILSRVEIANVVSLKEANKLKYKGFQVVSYFLSACSRHSKVHFNLSQSTLD